MSVLYEVNVKADKDISSEFKKWLLEHIKEMIQLEGFISAELYEFEDKESNKDVYVSQYKLKDQQGKMKSSLNIKISLICSIISDGTLL